MAGDDFAGLLRELKERSGLSYGTLGKRLHMSASTLHRYVSGEVVPVEFAPVERLARACRATPEELLELHRRWIRADALRGVKRSQETAGETEKRETAEADVPEAAGVSEVAVEGKDAPPAPDAPPVPGAPPAPDAPSALDVPSAPAPVERRRRVPRAALYAATGVAAVALVVSLLPGMGDGEEPHGPTGADAGTSVSVTGTATRSGSPSASVSPSPSSASPSASASASSVPSPSATRRSTASPSGRAPGNSGPALTVSTTPYYWSAPCEQAFLVDRSPQNVLRPPAQADVAGWVAAFGAVAADRQMTMFTVQGTGPETVVLEDLHVRVVDSKEALDWNQYAMGIGCGGEASTKSFDVALDLGNPLAMPIAGQRDFPYTVSESDPELFYVNAHTSDHDVRWYLELEWSSGGRQGILRIDDHGKPFRTSAAKDSSYYGQPLGSDAWEYFPGE
ncbi:helix-turn-helix domain-containing protein [Streptomyces lancefieldiae]|uniref:Helix-turn-helix transcriptional regulator n=1 Tax=Streptomyces lancefieldiae TaxID=3075520 RepID=A0ABU3AYM9_9ACTN|nr:helix-turn-helix transcriptional regulator [Streptomyces sp. DSM 40712]MDT0615289.1 helix-turn-helix transcriptional regulator [Streptomyces sp. DSM 40712]